MFLLFLCSDIDMVSSAELLLFFFGRNVFCLLLLHLDVWPSLCRKMFVQNVWLQKAVFTFICWREGSISVLTLNLGFILDYCVTSQLVGSPKNATYTNTSFKQISNKSLGIFAYSQFLDFIYAHLSLRNCEYISFFFFFFEGGVNSKQSIVICNLHLHLGVSDRDILNLI